MTLVAVQYPWIVPGWLSYGSLLHDSDFNTATFLVFPFWEQ